MKRKIYTIYGAIHALKYPKILKASIQSIFDERIYDNRKHIEMAADWLLYMQNEDGGYSRKFDFVSGRDKSYIETTGYIVPTLLRLGEEKYVHSALRAGEWLLRVQNSDGSFSEIDTYRPFVFDTGQVLFGLNALYAYTKEERYKKAIVKAATWLADVQEEDGSWERYAYNRQKHTYYSRVAAALFEAAKITENDLFRHKAMKHISWVLGCQSENGFFRFSAFLEGTPPYLHTIVYVLEGLLDSYEYTREEKILEAVLKHADRLKRIQMQRDLILCSQYDEDFRCVNTQRCITGLAQWAGVALRLYRLTQDNLFLQSAMATLFYLKAKQIKSSSMRGGFSASIPFWGRYGAFGFVNWSNKFFIDAMLAYREFGIAQTQEQERYVSAAFSVSSSVVTEELSYMDLKYIEMCEKRFDANRPKKVLDIGCGKGAILKVLKRKYPDIEFVGVDPTFEGEDIRKGSVYDIPFQDNSFDAVITFEVLQHTYLEKALGEIYRVLKPGGILCIGERNPLSLLGFVKPLYELLGKWMYPFDSPFREKWYGAEAWQYHLKVSGFEMKDIAYLDNKNDKIPKTNRYFFITGEKV